MAQLAACKHPAACFLFEAVLLPSRRRVPALEIQMPGHILAENQIIRGGEGAVSLCCQLFGIWQQLPLNGGFLALQDIFQPCYSLMKSVSLPQAVWPSASLSLVLGSCPGIKSKQLFFKESLWLPVLLQPCRPRHLSIPTGCLPFWPGLSTTGSCSPWFTTTPDPSLQGCYPGTVPLSHGYSLLGEGKCSCVRMHRAEAGANLPKFTTVW